MICSGAFLVPVVSPVLCPEERSDGNEARLGTDGRVCGDLYFNLRHGRPAKGAATRELFRSLSVCSGDLIRRRVAVLETVSFRSLPDKMRGIVQV